MKKIWLLFLLFFPYLVLAYSDYVLVGGETIGLEVQLKGILVIGKYKINNKVINDDFEKGDIITHINGEEIFSINNLNDLINKYVDNNKVNIKYQRGEEEKEGYMYLIDDNGYYKTGLYIKEKISGIGTLTYIDPNTKVYGILGHVINESNTQNKAAIRNGSTYKASIKSFSKSTNGNPGKKNAEIDKDNVFGNIKSNTYAGVYGTTTNNYRNTLMQVASLDEVQLGKASILTSDLNNEVQEYDIEIIKIDKKDQEKNIYFKVIDEDLISLSGGIVQGQSGSPIIQNNKLIGAVTRVIVDDVTKGYGISIITMLEEGDKNVD